MTPVPPSAPDADGVAPDADGVALDADGVASADVRDLSALPETPDTYGAFPRLNDHQLAAVAAVGVPRRVDAGEVLYREGDGDGDFFVIVEGAVALVEDYDGTQRVIGIHGPRRFLGELGLLTGERLFVSAVVARSGEVLVVPADRLREIVNHDPVLGDFILQALLMRRSILIGLGVGFRIVGSRYSSDTRRLRDFAIRNRLPHHWIDLESDPGADALLQRLGVPASDCPIVLLGPGRVLRNPSNTELARALGLRAPRSVQTTCDLLVVGAGPAGLAAAVYGASDGLSTVAVEGLATGGQAGRSSRIENYLGFPAGISGAELAERATIQAEKFGAQIMIPGEAVDIEPANGMLRVELRAGGSVAAQAVVIATGVRYRRLAVAGLEALEGTSVYYAATQSEANLCHNDPVAVVGGGNSAGQAATFLARFVPRVSMVVREAELEQSMSRYLADRVRQDPRIDVLLHSELRELIGEGVLEAVRVQDIDSGEMRELEAKALFVFVGAEPHTDWLRGRLALDEGGYVLTGQDAASARGGGGAMAGRQPLLLETSLPGVFAAGDVRSGSTQRVAAAVGDGAIAVRLVHQFLGGSVQAVVLGQAYVVGV
jgi:thioredoxin reductase (NADPH)